jgi:hypothetical protein
VQGHNKPLQACPRISAAIQDYFARIEAHATLFILNGKRFVKQRSLKSLKILVINQVNLANHFHLGVKKDDHKGTTTLSSVVLNA